MTYKIHDKTAPRKESGVWEKIASWVGKDLADSASKNSLLVDIQSSKVTLNLDSLLRNSDVTKQVRELKTQ